jgi:two-component sensor histidine kinase/PAS domain-containing protein
MARSPPRLSLGERPPSDLASWRVEGLLAEFGVAAGCVAVATLIGALLRPISPELLPAALLFPAILFPSLVGGWRSGVAAAALSIAARYWILRPAIDVLDPGGRLQIGNLAAAVVVAGLVIALGSYVRLLLERLRRSRDALSEHNLHYGVLFETITEGFAICEAVRDREGALVDYEVVEINPALRKLLGVGAEAIGSRLSDSPGSWSRWLKLCDHALTTGKPVRFERFNPANGLWHEVHINRLSATRMAQFFFDITERKAGEARQTELFEELNHRVKNNLAMVVSFLQLQGRGATAEVRGELAKAAARVQSIVEVHEALAGGGAADEVEFGAYLRHLCQGLQKSLTADGRLRFEVDVETADLPVDTALNLGMVVNELVTNACKYAYPRGGDGVIEVRFRRLGDELSLSVRDGGQGLPPGKSQTGGLGMRLVRSLVEQVGGRMAIDRDGAGAHFDIRLPAGAPARASS